MLYIIMCGGKYKKWETPRQLLKINGETIVDRTIRLLRECGVDYNFIRITATDERFIEKYGEHLVMKHDNGYCANGDGTVKGYWCDGFIPLNSQACYLFGDVIFSKQAIKTIVETQTDDIEFFASSPPFSDMYCKEWAEPFALKVANQSHFQKALAKVRDYEDKGLFARHHIMWEVWQVIKDTPINEIDFNNYVAINDYTCDVDNSEDIETIKQYITKEWLE